MQLQVPRRQGVEQVDQQLLCVLVDERLRGIHGCQGGMEQEGQVAPEVFVVLIGHLCCEAQRQLRARQQTPAGGSRIQGFHGRQSGMEQEGQVAAEVFVVLIGHLCCEAQHDTAGPCR